MFAYEKEGFGVSVVESCTPGHVSIRANHLAIMDAEKVTELVAALAEWLETQPKEQTVFVLSVKRGESFTFGGLEYTRAAEGEDAEGYVTVNPDLRQGSFRRKLYRAERVTVVR